MPAAKLEKRPGEKTAKFEQAVARMNDLPTIPNTLLKIWELVEDPSSSAADLERVIAMDQALTAKIIRLANSPYHGIREPIASCRRAVTMLGFKTVKNLSVCVSVVSACIPPRKGTAEIDLGELWKHSVSTGVIAEEMAARVGGIDPGTAFTAGVLHDIGKFVMSLCLRGTYGQAIREARTNNIFLHEAEENVLGANHAYAGLRLAEKWGFPPSLQAAIARHHQEMPIAGPVELLEVVARANEIARHLKLGASGDNKVVHASPETFERIGVLAAERDAFLQYLETRVGDARDMISLVV